LREQATLDPLTGIANRRLFEQHTATQMQLAAKEHRTVVVALADIDFFKQYNDTHGHDAGDQAIRATAHRLRNNATRPADIVARIGGEEFGIFLYDISLSDAQKILQRIVDDVRKAYRTTAARFRFSPSALAPRRARMAKFKHC
jgi:diguanylate cyclase (GGDEF)-like protein